MRSLATALLSAAVLASSVTLFAGPAGATSSGAGSVAVEVAVTTSTEKPLSAYVSEWDDVERSVTAITEYLEELGQLQGSYRSHEDRLERRADSLDQQIAELGREQSILEAAERKLAGKTRSTRSALRARTKDVGQLARSLYRGQRPEMIALAQVLDGEDLSAFEQQNLLSAAVVAGVADVRDLKARDHSLTAALEQRRLELKVVSSTLKRTTKERQAVQQSQELVQSALAAIQADRVRAEETRKEILAAQRAALRAAKQVALLADQTDAGVPKDETFRAALPGDIPYRDVFVTYGNQYGVEPALLAAIAAQESGFNPFAGCLRSGGGKGIMQHESQALFCGVDAVGPSVAKSASMLAGYYRASGSWNAAVFAYNNGPGLMDEWIAHSADPAELISVLTTFYDAQSYASAGPYGGYGSWGAWRARVAYSYASANPLPGFQSAVTRWLEYRAG